MAEYICYACMNEGPGRKRKRASGKSELWVYLLITPLGPFYSVWRRLGLKRVCVQCGMDTVVKVTSEQGQIAKRRLDMELGIAPEKKKDAVSVTTAPAPAMVEDKREPKKPANPEEW